MKQRTGDGLRTIEVQALDGGRTHRIIVHIHPDGGKDTPAESSHVFRTYPSYGLGSGEYRAMRIFRELTARRESLGLLNWETSSMGVEIMHDGSTYEDLLKFYSDITRKGHEVTGADVHGFAGSHGYTISKSIDFVELVDWVELAGWFENGREEYAQNDPELIRL